MKNATAAIISVYFVTFTCSQPSWAALIFASDHQGNVAQYDTDTASVALLGTLSGFTVGKVMGLAYDPVTDSVLIIDRNRATVYAMDARTGAASPLFTFTGELQGGAVKRGLLYGIDEITQTIEVYSLSDFTDQGLSSPVSFEHTHALGVDAVSGQLYSQGLTTVNGQTNGIFRQVSDDGTIEDPPILVSQTDFFYNDIDYWNGNFVGMIQGRGVDLIDGSTGSTSALLTSSQLQSVGLDVSVAGHGIAVLTDVPPASADFDEDGDVDGDDFLLWQTGFGTPSGATKMDGDCDNDGDVDGDDFLGWQSEFGSGSSSGSAAVPEPRSVLLMGGAAVVGMFVRRRRVR